MKRPAVEKNGELSGKSGILRPELRVVHGGLYVARALTPEQQLERAFRSICAAAKVQRESGTFGGYASRAVADVAQGLRCPSRVIARLIASVIEGYGPDDFAERLAASLLEYSDRKRFLVRGCPEPPRDDHKEAA